jgi:NAD+ synthase (glutamine-hydrolysing)
MQIGLAQINTTVGDFSGNKNKIIEAYQKLCQQGAQLVIFPELTVTGYPPRDLIFKRKFVPDNTACLQSIACVCGDVPALIGFIDAGAEKGQKFYNAAAWCVNGQIQQIARKCLLPTYDVFDDSRYFHAAQTPTIVQYKNQSIGITICEDIWTGSHVPAGSYYELDPVEQLSVSSIDLLVNLSASPWQCGKSSFREILVKDAAFRCKCPVVYCNAVGGNDELIFDGNSIVVSDKGEVLSRLAGFSEELRVVDTRTQRGDRFSESALEIADVYNALVLGLRDYAHKNGFKKALVGLSGGIDSAVTAAIGVAALGKENLLGVSLPSIISSEHSRVDAQLLAQNLGIEYKSFSIASIMDAAENTLAPFFKGMRPDATEENLQARSRGLLLMALSNKLGALLLSTGNKSELAVGYCTLYGDMCGGLAVISDVPKMKVYELAHWLNREDKIIPENTINKSPSAELRPDQKDQDSLPPYEILDPILEKYVEQGQSSNEIIEAGFDPKIVKEIVRMVDLNEYKRKQAAPGLKITPLAFGTGRRMPLVQKYVN